MAEIVLFGGELKEVSWRHGKMPPPGTKVYAAPQASEAVRDALIAFDEAMSLCNDFPELQHHRDALLFAVQKARAALSAQPGAQNPHPKRHNDGDVTYG